MSRHDFYLIIKIDFKVIIVSLGDSGSSLVFPQLEDGQEVYYIRGIVSNTRQALQGGCDSWYSLFTNVLSSIDFIKKARKEHT